MIASGNTYQSGGMYKVACRRKNSGNAGKGMLVILTYRSRCADPSKNEFGRTGAILFPVDASTRSVSAGNAPFIVPTFLNSEFGIGLVSSLQKLVMAGWNRRE